MASSSSTFGPRAFSGRGSYRGGRGGRGFSGSKTTDAAMYDVCRFHVRSGNCRNGDNCRFVHNISNAFSVAAHESPIHTLAVLNTPEIPKVLSGSSDKTVKLWNLGTDVPCEEGKVPTNGKVTHIEVSGNTIMWAVDEPLIPSQQDLCVGVVHLFNPADRSTIPVKRSDDIPYTHSFGDIRNFIIIVVDNTSIVVTAGGEGLIKMWRYDSGLSRFEQLSVLEGHIRAVTSLLLNDKLLWSGSLDNTIRVWDLGTNKCIGILSSSTNGHNGSITCLCHLSGAGMGNENFIVSGGTDCEVKLWKPNGEFVHSCSHSTCVTAICPFQDAIGGIQVLLVGLADGSILVRSASTMTLMIVLDSTLCNTKSVWSIVSLGKSCFAAGGEDGQLICWKIDKPLLEKSS